VWWYRGVSLPSTDSGTAIIAFYMRRREANTSEITLAGCSSPVGDELAILRIHGHARVHAVVHEEVGVGAGAKRAVLVADHRRLVGRAVAVVVGPPGVAVHWRGIYRPGDLESDLLDGVIGAHAEAGVQQVGDGAGLARVVVLEVAEGGTHHIMAGIVVLVTADREIGQLRLRQAAAIGDFLRRSGVADVLGFAH